MKRSLSFIPHEQIVLTEKFYPALYGSNLLDMSSPDAEMVFAAWRTGHKGVGSVHRGCRSYIVGPSRDKPSGADYMQVWRFLPIPAGQPKPQGESGGQYVGQGPAQQCGRQSGSNLAGDRTGPMGCGT